MDQLIQHVVAQEKVAMTNKCKATFMLPTVRIVVVRKEGEKFAESEGSGKRKIVPDTFWEKGA